MANTNPSPNMSLPIPVVGQETGPQWASDVNNSLTLIDAHTHAPGSGVPITPSGMNITTDLPFNGNNATSLRSTRFTSQGSALAGASDLCCFYVVGADVWYNDGNANQIQLTSGGSVNATSSGISSGSATASFSSSVLVVNAAANTPADIQGASLLLGNNIANTKFLTLSPPNSMSANFQLTLPSIPAQTNIMTLDTSGNIAAVTNVDNTTIQISSNNLQVVPGGIGTTQIAVGGVAQSNLYTRLTGTSVPAGNVALSPYTSSSGTTSSLDVPITSLITLVTTGRPVKIEIVAQNGWFQASALSSLVIYTDSSTSPALATTFGIASSPQQRLPVFSFISVPSAGTHTFQLFGNTNGTLTWGNVGIIAYEL